MSELNKDVVIGVLFLTGVASFISGQFIISTLIFGSAAIFSTIAQNSAYYKNNEQI